MMRPRMDTVLQVVIALTGGLGIWLVGEGPGLARWGWLLGLAGQPAWIVSTWRSRQWGMLALSLWWTAAWARGAWSCWLG